MNSNEMKAAMKRNNDTQQRLAEALGLHTSGINSRINGHTDFRVSEISKIVKRYNLTANDVSRIFFDENASY